VDRRVRRAVVLSAAIDDPWNSWHLIMTLHIKNLLMTLHIKNLLMISHMT
jgi:hypothetical protein